MRVWKNNKGIFASLVLVIGVVTLRCTLSWAQTPNVAQGVQPALKAGQLTSSLTAAKDALNAPPSTTTTKDAVSAPSSSTAAKDALQLAPSPLPPSSAAPPMVAPPPPQIGVADDAAMAPSPTVQPAPSPSSSSPSDAAPQNAPATAPSFLPKGGDSQSQPSRLPPPPSAKADNLPARRPNANNQPALDDRLPSRQAPSRASRQAPANEADIFKVVPQTCVPAKGQFIWNFEEEELINILRQVSDLLCKTIVVNDSIGKNLKMTIIGKSPISPRDAWDVLMASLASKGLALIEQGKTWTVIKRNETKSYATPMYSDGKNARNNEEIGTLFYKAQHASQDVLKNVARVLISKDGMVDAIGDQFIIVIDSNSNIRRLGGIFAQVDIEDAINKIHIVPLLNADAKTIEKQLRELFDVTPGSNRASRKKGAGDGKSGVEIDKIIADERTNSMIIVADKEAFDKLKEVVALIDQPAADQTNKGKIHVKKLRFADAKKIAETLNNVVQQGKSNRFGRRRPEDGTVELFEGEVKITAHENTNTLVTVASATDYRSLLTTINSLDVRKEQVYVEAVILDIQVNDNNDFGINLFGGLDPAWMGGHLGMVANPGGQAMAGAVAGALAKGSSSSTAANLGPGHGMGALAVLSNFLGGGVVGISGANIPGTDVPSFGAILKAISQNQQVDILSTPYLLTTDNQEAEMSVGEKIPTVRGTSMAGSGGVGASLGVPLQNVQYEDVKLTLKITPHVGADDNVRLDIDQVVNEVGAVEKVLNQDQYRIRTKTAKTQLVLKDQQTGVIGGLISHTSKTSDNKVPLLGDIPILGWLFKNRNTQNERKNLLLIITPYVIRTDEDYKKILDKKLKEREEFSQMYYGGKIKTYNKFVDYDKKPGPLTSMLLQVGSEMNKAENGGAGTANETVITPKENNAPKTTPGASSVDGITGSDETVFFNEAPTYSESDVVLDEFAGAPSEDSGSPDVVANP